MIKQITIRTEVSTIIIEEDKTYLLKGDYIANEDLCYIHGMVDALRHQKMVKEQGKETEYGSHDEGDE